MNIVSRFSLLLVFICFAGNCFADEIMSCKINKNQLISYKLENNTLSEDKIFSKVGVEWKRQCPCEKIKNKSISCSEGQTINECKRNENDYKLVPALANKILIDFETRLLKVDFYKTGKLVTFKCELAK